MIKIIMLLLWRHLLRLMYNYVLQDIEVTQVQGWIFEYSDLKMQLSLFFKGFQDKCNYRLVISRFGSIYYFI